MYIDKHKPKQYTCRFCHKKFLGLRKEKRNKKVVYCSPKCATEANKKVPGRPPAKELLEALKNGESFVSLGRKYGVSDNAVRKWVRADGLEVPKVKMPSAEIECSSINCSKIVKKEANRINRAKQNFCSKDCRDDYVRANGPLAGVTKGEIEGMLASGMSLRAVARHFGVNHSTISKRFFQ